MKKTVEIGVEEYINLRNTINELRTENYRLNTIITSIAVVLKNSDFMKQGVRGPKNGTQ
ncbi:hypothetical protein [Streptococcus constellatus]|uniref:hypothetical protein n=1 Tax=Streptococcus constellatus TaxID=76860 RepID=UPI0028EF7093|nr:hypothetical protein [Streptococcus constellatus]